MSYTITTIVDSSGVLSSFLGSAINNNGTVTYNGLLDSGVTGIYTDAGTVVVDSNGAFQSFDEPVINNNGTIAY